MSDVPNIAAIQIYFLRHPVINFELTSALAMLDMFSTGDLIRSVLKDQISKALVYPNTINIKLSPNAEDLSFKMPKIDGVVKIKIGKVYEILNQEIFFNISLGNEIVKSKIAEVIEKTAKFDVEHDLISYRDGDNEIEITLNEVAEDGVNKIGR
jgi:hypothetical protein